MDAELRDAVIRQELADDMQGAAKQICENCKDRWKCSEMACAGPTFLQMANVLVKKGWRKSEKEVPNG